MGGKKYQSIDRKFCGYHERVICLPDKVTKHFVTMQADAVTSALVTAYILRATIFTISIPLRIIEPIIEEERESPNGFVALRVIDIIFISTSREAINN